MADKKPLVIGANGAIAQLQDADAAVIKTIAPTSKMLGVNTASPSATVDITQSDDPLVTFGSEKLVNGTFTSDLSSWTIQATPTGTVTTTGSDVNVAGTGTNFTACFNVGDSISIGGVTKIIATITSDTLLTTTTQFAANTDVPFAVVGGWLWNSSGVVEHVAGNSKPLTQVQSATAGNLYRFIYTITGNAGSITNTLGSDSESYLRSASGSAVTHYFTAPDTTPALTITPTATFAGTLSGLSFVALIASTAQAVNIRKSNGTSILGIRGLDANLSIGYSNGSYYSTATTQNTSVGYYAGSRLLGSYNSLFGYSAGRYITVGVQNCAFGSFALNFCRDGSNNSAFGQETLTSLKSGSSNCAFGWRSGNGLTTGAQNVFNGGMAGYAAQTGNNNVGIGYQALRLLTTGGNNVGVGYNTIFYITTANNNVAVGYAAGQSAGDSSTPSTNSNCVLIGASTKFSANATTNENVFGYNATGMGSNTVTLGSNAVTNNYLYKSLTLRYDANNYLTQSVASDGKTTFTATGTTPNIAVQGLTIDNATTGVVKLTVPADSSFQRGYFKGTAKTLTESVATGIAEISCTAGQIVSGDISYHVEAGDNTPNLQVETGLLRFVAYNIGGTLTVDLSSSQFFNKASSGTLTVTPTATAGTNKITLNINAVSSLTQTYLRCYWKAENVVTGVVTAL